MSDDDQRVLDQHDEQVRIVTESVFGLVDKFQIPPATLFEGALKAAVLAMATRQGDSPQEIADLLVEAADVIRRMEPDAWTPARN